MMKFNNIDHLILFGGSRCCAELALEISKNDDYKLNIFTCKRQLEEPIYPNGKKLKEFFLDNSLSYVSTDDINDEPELIQLITENTLGIGLGEAWTFSPEIIEKFGGRLIDLMGIPLPQYRGGAHYTWQILMENKMGSCNLQMVNEHTVQGVFDSGEIIKTENYNFPNTVRNPNDYFEVAVAHEIKFVKEFLNEINKGKNFHPKMLEERFSTYFPRLNTLKHGFINWNWNTRDIENFICAFDDPYQGASTFIDNKKVHLKSCISEFIDGPFHPFQSGLIYRIYESSIFVASNPGTLIVKTVLDENGNDVTSTLRYGQRFFTPSTYLENAMKHSAEYYPYYT
ncbi:hypothetical protein M1N55_02225 [Dehalococcoidia bacterium]|nr:hypothetical protein [Dehalococcoidia bacterium]